MNEPQQTLQQVLTRYIEKAIITKNDTLELKLALEKTIDGISVEPVQLLPLLQGNTIAYIEDSFVVLKLKKNDSLQANWQKKRKVIAKTPAEELTITTAIRKIALDQNVSLLERTRTLDRIMGNYSRLYGKLPKNILKVYEEASEVVNLEILKNLNEVCGKMLTRLDIKELVTPGNSKLFARKNKDQDPSRDFSKLTDIIEMQMQASIMSDGDFQAAICAVKRWILLAGQAAKEDNLLLAMLISVMLNGSEYRGLMQQIALEANEYQRLYVQLQSLVGETLEYTTYRQVLTQRLADEKSVIPNIGVIKQDLSYLDEKQIFKDNETIEAKQKKIEDILVTRMPIYQNLQTCQSRFKPKKIEQTIEENLKLLFPEAKPLDQENIIQDNERTIDIFMAMAKKIYPSHEEEEELPLIQLSQDLPVRLYRDLEKIIRSKQIGIKKDLNNEQQIAQQAIARLLAPLPSFRRNELLNAIIINPQVQNNLLQTPEKLSKWVLEKAPIEILLTKENYLKTLELNVNQIFNSKIEVLEKVENQDLRNFLIQNLQQCELETITKEWVIALNNNKKKLDKLIPFFIQLENKELAIEYCQNILAWKSSISESPHFMRRWLIVQNQESLQNILLAQQEISNNKNSLIPLEQQRNWDNILQGKTAAIFFDYRAPSSDQQFNEKLEQIEAIKQSCDSSIPNNIYSNCVINFIAAYKNARPVTHEEGQQQYQAAKLWIQQLENETLRAALAGLFLIYKMASIQPQDERVQVALYRINLTTRIKDKEIDWLKELKILGIDAGQLTPIEMQLIKEENKRLQEVNNPKKLGFDPQDMKDWEQYFQQFEIKLKDLIKGSDPTFVEEQEKIATNWHWSAYLVRTNAALPEELKKTKMLLCLAHHHVAQELKIHDSVAQFIQQQALLTRLLDLEPAHIIAKTSLEQNQFETGYARKLIVEIRNQLNSNGFVQIKNPLERVAIAEKNTELQPLQKPSEELLASAEKNEFRRQSASNEFLSTTIFSPILQFLSNLQWISEMIVQLKILQQGARPDQIQLLQQYCDALQAIQIGASEITAITTREPIAVAQKLQLFLQSNWSLFASVIHLGNAIEKDNELSLALQKWFQQKNYCTLEVMGNRDFVGQVIQWCTRGFNLPLGELLSETKKAKDYADKILEDKEANQQYQENTIAKRKDELTQQIEHLQSVQKKCNDVSINLNKVVQQLEQLDELLLMPSQNGTTAYAIDVLNLKINELRAGMFAYFVYPENRKKDDLSAVQQQAILWLQSFIPYVLGRAHSGVTVGEQITLLKKLPLMLTLLTDLTQPQKLRLPGHVIQLLEKILAKNALPEKMRAEPEIIKAKETIQKLLSEAVKHHFIKPKLPLPEEMKQLWTKEITELSSLQELEQAANQGFFVQTYSNAPFIASVVDTLNQWQQTEKLTKEQKQQIQNFQQAFVQLSLIGQAIADINATDPLDKAEQIQTLLKATRGHEVIVWFQYTQESLWKSLKEDLPLWNSFVARLKEQIAQTFKMQGDLVNTRFNQLIASPFQWLTKYQTTLPAVINQLTEQNAEVLLDQASKLKENFGVLATRANKLLDDLEGISLEKLTGGKTQSKLMPTKTLNQQLKDLAQLALFYATLPIGEARNRYAKTLSLEAEKTISWLTTKIAGKLKKYQDKNIGTDNLNQLNQLLKNLEAALQINSKTKQMDLQQIKLPMQLASAVQTILTNVEQWPKKTALNQEIIKQLKEWTIESHNTFSELVLNYAAKDTKEIRQLDTQQLRTELVHAIGLFPVGRIAFSTLQLTIVSDIEAGIKLLKLSESDPLVIAWQKKLEKTKDFPPSDKSVNDLLDKIADGDGLKLSLISRVTLLDRIIANYQRLYGELPTAIIKQYTVLTEGDDYNSGLNKDIAVELQTISATVFKNLEISAFAKTGISKTFAGAKDNPTAEMSKQFNDIAEKMLAAVTEHLIHGDMQAALLMVKRLIIVAAHSLAYGNLYTAIAINGGVLGSTACYPLIQEIEKEGGAYQHILNRMTQLQEKNSVILRNLEERLGPKGFSVIPFIGTTNTDLLYIEDGSTIESDMSLQQKKSKVTALIDGKRKIIDKFLGYQEKMSSLLMAKDGNQAQQTLFGLPTEEKKTKSQQEEIAKKLNTPFSKTIAIEEPKNLAKEMDKFIKFGMPLKKKKEKKGAKLKINVPPQIVEQTPEQSVRAEIAQLPKNRRNQLITALILDKDQVLEQNLIAINKVMSSQKLVALKQFIWQEVSLENLKQCNQEWVNTVNHKIERIAPIVAPLLTLNNPVLREGLLLAIDQLPVEKITEKWIDQLNEASDLKSIEILNELGLSSNKELLIWFKKQEPSVETYAEALTLLRQVNHKELANFLIKNIQACDLTQITSTWVEQLNYQENANKIKVLAEPIMALKDPLLTVQLCQGLPHWPQDDAVEIFKLICSQGKPVTQEMGQQQIKNATWLLDLHNQVLMDALKQLLQWMVIQPINLANLTQKTAFDQLNFSTETSGVDWQAALKILGIDENLLTKQQIEAINHENARLREISENIVNPVLKQELRSQRGATSKTESHSLELKLGLTKHSSSFLLAGQFTNNRELIKSLLNEWPPQYSAGLLTLIDQQWQEVAIYHFESDQLKLALAHILEQLQNKNTSDLWRKTLDLAFTELGLAPDFLAKAQVKITAVTGKHRKLNGYDYLQHVIKQEQTQTAIEQLSNLALREALLSQLNILQLKSDSEAIEPIVQQKLAVANLQQVNLETMLSELLGQVAFTTSQKEAILREERFNRLAYKWVSEPSGATIYSVAILHQHLKAFSEQIKECMLRDTENEQQTSALQRNTNQLLTMLATYALTLLQSNHRDTLVTTAEIAAVLERLRAVLEASQKVLGETKLAISASCQNLLQRIIDNPKPSTAQADSAGIKNLLGNTVESAPIFTDIPRFDSQNLQELQDLNEGLFITWFGHPTFVNEVIKAVNEWQKQQGPENLLPDTQHKLQNFLQAMTQLALLAQGIQGIKEADPIKKATRIAEYLKTTKGVEALMWFSYLKDELVKALKQEITQENKPTALEAFVEVMNRKIIQIDPQASFKIDTIFNSSDMPWLVNYSLFWGKIKEEQNQEQNLLQEDFNGLISDYDKLKVQIKEPFRFKMLQGGHGKSKLVSSQAINQHVRKIADFMQFYLAQPEGEIKTEALERLNNELLNVLSLIIAKISRKLNKIQSARKEDIAEKKEELTEKLNKQEKNDVKLLLSQIQQILDLKKSLLSPAELVLPEQLLAVLGPTLIGCHIQAKSGTINQLIQKIDKKIQPDRDSLQQAIDTFAAKKPGEIHATDRQNLQKALNHAIAGFVPGKAGSMVALSLNVVSQIHAAIHLLGLSESDLSVQEWQAKLTKTKQFKLKKSDVLEILQAVVSQDSNLSLLEQGIRLDLILGNYYQLYGPVETKVLAKYQELRQALNQQIIQQLDIVSGHLFRELNVMQLAEQGISKTFDNPLQNPFQPLTNLFKELTYQVPATILASGDLHTSIMTARQWLAIAAQFVQNGNIHIAAGIYSGLGQGGCSQFMDYLKEMDPEARQISDQIKALLSPSKNFSCMREFTAHALKENQPFLPYTGNFTSDLTFLEDGNPIDGDKANNGIKFIIDKKQEIYTTLQLQQQKYQSETYSKEQNNQAMSQLFPGVDTLGTVTQGQLNQIADSTRKIYPKRSQEEQFKTQPVAFEKNLAKQVVHKIEPFIPKESQQEIKQSIVGQQDQQIPQKVLTPRDAVVNFLAQLPKEPRNALMKEIILNDQIQDDLLKFQTEWLQNKGQEVHPPVEDILKYVAIKKQARLNKNILAANQIISSLNVLEKTWHVEQLAAWLEMPDERDRMLQGKETLDAHYLAIIKALKQANIHMPDLTDTLIQERNATNQFLENFPGSREDLAQAILFRQQQFQKIKTQLFSLLQQKLSGQRAAIFKDFIDPEKEYTYVNTNTPQQLDENLSCFEALQKFYPLPNQPREQIYIDSIGKFLAYHKDEILILPKEGSIQLAAAKPWLECLTNLPLRAAIEKMLLERKVTFKFDEKNLEQQRALSQLNFATQPAGEKINWQLALKNFGLSSSHFTMKQVQTITDEYARLRELRANIQNPALLEFLLKQPDLRLPNRNLSEDWLVLNRKSALKDHSDLMLQKIFGDVLTLQTDREQYESTLQSIFGDKLKLSEETFENIQSGQIFLENIAIAQKAFATEQSGTLATRFTILLQAQWPKVAAVNFFGEQQEKALKTIIDILQTKGELLLCEAPSFKPESYTDWQKNLNEAFQQLGLDADFLSTQAMAVRKSSGAIELWDGYEWLYQAVREEQTERIILQIENKALREALIAQRDKVILQIIKEPKELLQAFHKTMRETHLPALNLEACISQLLKGVKLSEQQKANILEEERWMRLVPNLKMNAVRLMVQVKDLAEEIKTLIDESEQNLQVTNIMDISEQKQRLVALQQALDQRTKDFENYPSTLKESLKQRNLCTYEIENVCDLLEKAKELQKNNLEVGTKVINEKLSFCKEQINNLLIEKIKDMQSLTMSVDDLKKQCEYVKNATPQLHYELINLQRRVRAEVTTGNGAKLESLQNEMLMQEPLLTGQYGKIQAMIELLAEYQKKKEEVEKKTGFKTAENWSKALQESIDLLVKSLYEEKITYQALLKTLEVQKQKVQEELQKRNFIVEEDTHNIEEHKHSYEQIFNEQNVNAPLMVQFNMESLIPKLQLRLSEGIELVSQEKQKSRSKTVNLDEIKHQPVKKDLPRRKTEAPMLQHSQSELALSRILKKSKYQENSSMKQRHTEQVLSQKNRLDETEHRRQSVVPRPVPVSPPRKHEIKEFSGKYKDDKIKVEIASNSFLVYSDEKRGDEYHKKLGVQRKLFSETFALRKNIIQQSVKDLVKSVLEQYPQLTDKQIMKGMEITGYDRAEKQIARDSVPKMIKTCREEMQAKMREEQEQAEQELEQKQGAPSLKRGKGGK